MPLLCLSLLALLPVTSFAEQPAAAAPNSSALSAPLVATPETAPEAVEPPQLTALREKLAALGEQANAEQISAAQQQFITDNGIAPRAGPAVAGSPARRPRCSLKWRPMRPCCTTLSPWGMYQNADVVVKSVMIGLILASILTWTVWVAKSIELISARRRLRRELPELKRARNLQQAAEQARAQHSFSTILIEEAQDELQLSANSKLKEGHQGARQLPPGAPGRRLRP